MRTGYAAFVLGNYSESLKHYEKVYRDDPENNIALYYAYLGNVYLNNTHGARFYAGKLPEETRRAEAIKKTRVASLNLEYSNKITDLSDRGDAQYGRLGFTMQLGYRVELQQAAGFYQQQISEPALTAVTNNRKIDIAQKEYYAKLTVAASGKLYLVGGLHYLYTPFNNFIYNNLIGFAGVKYNTPYVQLQGMLNIGRIRDSSFNQIDAVVTTYPLGNTNIYTITRAAYGDDFTLTQVAGFRLLKNTWLEGNITVGEYQILLANDALYVFDDIDTKKWKAGGSLYLLLAKKIGLSANYTFEKKQRYGTVNGLFNQHSITGGLTWNF
jgi:hypothetical protein